MKVIHYTFAFLLLACNVNSQELSFNQGKIDAKDYYEEIDFEMVYEKIIIPVTINEKTYKFLLDTGAPSVISKKLWHEINTKNVKKISVVDANNQVDSLEIAAVKSMKLKSLDFENNTVLAVDLDNHPILKCFKLDGFIGSNLFQHSILKISLKDKKITVTDDIKKLHLKSKATKLMLIGDQKSPYIKINFAGKNKGKGTEDVLIDTGMDGFYEISNRAYSIFSKEHLFEELSRSKGTSSIGLFGGAPIKEQVLFKSNSLTINNTTFENVITNTIDDSNSRLGLDLLKHGDIIIDFKNGKFYFEAEKTIPLQNIIPVFSPTIKDGKFVVGFVWDKSYQDRLSFGDEIIRIDNYKINEMGICEIVKLKNFRKNSISYEMEVKSKDNQTTVLKIENK